MVAADRPALAFPRHKPQFFAYSLGDLAAVSRHYSFGRKRSRMVRAGMPLVVRTPVIGKLLVARQEFATPCPPHVWTAFEREIRRSPEVSSIAVYQSQWRKFRFGVLGLSKLQEVVLFAQVRQASERYVLPRPGSWVFSVPQLLGELNADDWDLRIFEPMPPEHDPAPWDRSLLTEVAADASRALAGVLPTVNPPRPGWVPIHGDLTPWNLRVDRSGRIWLIDWEEAAWGPRHADLLRYLLSYGSVLGDDQEALVTRVRTELSDGPDVAEAAAFWLEHEFYRMEDHREWERPELGRGKTSDWARASLEVLALRRLAES